MGTALTNHRDDEKSSVPRLSDEERRKLFDLPEPAAPPQPSAGSTGPPRESFLELDTDRAAPVGGSMGAGKVVRTLTVRRPILPLFRVIAFTVLAGSFILWSIRFVYRY